MARSQKSTFTRNYLNELYVSERLGELTQRNEKQQLREANQRLLLEKLDEAQFKKLQQSIKNLARITSAYELPVLRKAITTAGQETSDIMSAGRGILSKLKTMIMGDGSVKQLAKVMAFEKTVVTGMKQLPAILDVITGADQNVQKAGDESLATILYNEEDNREYDTAKKAIVAAFTGPLKLFGSNIIPYLKNPEQLADELLKLSGNDFAKLAKNAEGLEVATPDDTAKELGKKAHEDQAETTGSDQEQATDNVANKNSPVAKAMTQIADTIPEFKQASSESITKLRKILNDAGLEG